MNHSLPNSDDKNRIALVTGGTRGIGAAICKALHQQGFKVVANYAANDEAAKIFSEETAIPVYKWDVCNPEACIDYVQKIEKECNGHIDILINNAGITDDRMLHKMTFEAWEKVIHTNLTSCFTMTQAVLHGMRERGYGRIINISSVNGLSGQLGQSNYAASKAGIIGFTKSLAKETAFKGITVNAVAPGYIATDMVKAMTPKDIEQITSQIPLKRLGAPEEVARCVTFLAANDAGYITGAVLSVNGGLYM